MTANGQEQLLHDYSELHTVLKEKLLNLNEDQLKWKAAPSVWSVTEVLSHLTDHAIVVGFRIREILSDSPARLAAFSQDEWVDATRANESSADEILAFYEAYLTYNLSLLKRLLPEDWDRKGINNKGAQVSLRDAISGFIQHVHNHIHQIERITSAYLVV